MTGRLVFKNWLLWPFVALLIGFWALPLVRGLILSLHSDSIYGPTRFVGLDHYEALWQDGRYWKALANTALFAGASILFTIPLAVLFAQALRLVWPWLRGVLSIIVMVPGLCPPGTMAILFLLVFHGEEGLLNRWLITPLGFEPVRWLVDPRFILSAIVLQSVWRWTGFMAFFVSSSLETQPQYLEEAAALEGAGFWGRFWMVNLPLLKPTILFCSLYLFVDCAVQFAGSYLLLGGSGGTSDAGLLLVSYAYQQAFVGGDFGSSAATSLSTAVWLGLALIVVAFVIIARRPNEVS